MLNRVVSVAFAAAVVLPSVAAAQPYLGGAFNVMTQTPSANEHLGGTTLSGSVVVGAPVSRRWAVEFEPSFSGPHSYTYTYRPGTISIADVVVRRHDSFYSFQLRRRGGVLEPVVGGSYVHGKISRHAVFSNGVTYFDDSRTDHGAAAVGGLDAAVKLAPHVSFTPGFRLFVRIRSTPDESFVDPLGDQTRTGAFTFRYGAGVRVAF